MVSTKIIVTEDFGVQKVSVSISQSSKKICMLILPKFTAEGSTFPKAGNWDVFKLYIYIYIGRGKKTGLLL